MLKTLVIGCLLVAFRAGGKVVPGKVIGPLVDDFGSDWPVSGSYYINKYAKIAREIVHYSSE